MRAIDPKQAIASLLRAERLDEDEGGRGLPPARVVKMVAREGQAPIFQRADGPASASCSATWPPITKDVDGGRPTNAEQAGKALALDVPRSLTCDGTQSVIALAMKGAGLAYLQEPCMVPLSHSGDLRLALKAWSSIGLGFYLYHPGRRQLPTGLRLLIDLVREMRSLALQQKHCSRPNELGSSFR